MEGIEISVKEKKEISLEILEKIHGFCEENKIQYFLNYGTLLGAVRHKGFIPWDDDIDIGMLRKDYENFKEKFNIDNLDLVHFENNKYYPVTFLKVSDNNTYGVLYDKYMLNYGVAVDVFPIDNYPDVIKEQKKFFKKQDLLITRYKYALACHYRSDNKKNIFKSFVKNIMSPFLIPRKYCEKINSNAQKYSGKNTRCAGCLMDILNHRIEIASKEDYSSRVLLDFEGEKFYGPEGWDNILKSLYGKDYMVPPPEKERVTAHTENYYWKDK